MHDSLLSTVFSCLRQQQNSGIVFEVLVGDSLHIGGCDFVDFVRETFVCLIAEPRDFHPPQFESAIKQVLMR